MPKQNIPKQNYPENKQKSCKNCFSVKTHKKPYIRAVPFLKEFWHSTIKNNLIIYPFIRFQFFSYFQLIGRKKDLNDNQMQKMQS